MGVANFIPLRNDGSIIRGIMPASHAVIIRRIHVVVQFITRVATIDFVSIRGNESVVLALFLKLARFLIRHPDDVFEGLVTGHGRCEPAKAIIQKVRFVALDGEIFVAGFIDIRHTAIRVDSVGQSRHTFKEAELCPFLIRPALCQFRLVLFADVDSKAAKGFRTALEAILNTLAANIGHDLITIDHKLASAAGIRAC